MVHVCSALVTRLGRGAVVVLAVLVGAVVAPTVVGATDLGFDRPYVEYVDTSRRTPANGTYKGATSRTIGVELAIPEGNGPFPVVVWSHGQGTPVRLSEPMYDALAAKGYLVVAPQYPLSNNLAPGGVTGTDRANQPGDLSFVLTKVIEASARPGNFLSGKVDPDRIGVAGESLGGYTTLGVLAPSGLDPRVKAAIVGAPAVFPAFPMAAPAGNVPVLYLAGDKDDLTATTRGFYDASRAPKWFGAIKGADHYAAIDPAQGKQPAIFATMIAFLDLYLRGDRTGATRLERISARGTVSLRSVIACGGRVPGASAARTRC
ncbi:MAG: hypothetical protein JWN67_4811 [Actinomycetia bacterium]|nr:hypothetical protein [Actinomycetes bacterium]